eukprot:Gb_40506 [translate_table: standard]
MIKSFGHDFVTGATHNQVGMDDIIKRRSNSYWNEEGCQYPYMDFLATEPPNEEGINSHHPLNSDNNMVQGPNTEGGICDMNRGEEATEEAIQDLPFSHTDENHHEGMPPEVICSIIETKLDSDPLPEALKMNGVEEVVLPKSDGSLVETIVNAPIEGDATEEEEKEMTSKHAKVELNKLE